MNSRMRQKEGVKKFLSVLNSKPVIGALIFVFLSLATVFAGNIIAREGSLVVDSNLTINGNYLCDSSNCYSINNLTSSGSSIPEGAIVAFSSQTCPSGWLLADGTSGTPDLRGIFIRGSGTNGILRYANSSYGYFNATYGTYGNDSLQGHKHNSTVGIVSNTGGGYGLSGSWFTWPNLASVMDKAVTDGINGDPRTGKETTPAYYATIYCVKTGSDSEISNSIWQTSNGNVSLANSSNMIVNNGSYQIMTRDTSYIPTFTGFGTVSNVNFFYSRVGNHLKVMGKFTSGITTATEARISLPSGLTSDGNLIPSIMYVGDVKRSNNVAILDVYIESGVGYITMGSVLAKSNANSLVSSGDLVSLNFEIPISGW